MFSWLFGRRKPEPKPGPDSFGRAGAWRRVRATHLSAHPECAACGRTDEPEVHHVIPYHEQPELELDPENLITLCANPCHFVFGHLLNWRRSNPHVREDAARYRERMLACSEFPTPVKDCTATPPPEVGDSA